MGGGERIVLILETKTKSGDVLILVKQKLPRVVEYKIRRESWIKLRMVGKDVHRKNNPNRTVVEF